MDIQSFKKVLAEQSIIIESFAELNYGSNSSAWKIKSNGRFYFLKFYKNNVFDKRDRVGSESNFLELLRLGEISNVPKVIRLDKRNGWILLDWIEGYKIVNPSRKDWVMMMQFINRLQDLRNIEYSKNILNASEACFEMSCHFNLIKKRLNNLINLLNAQKINKETTNWLKNEVSLSLENSLSQINQSSNKKKYSKGGIKKVLSPSDVGFHNVIKQNGNLFFHDFEYAGWDDPYKLLVDLLIQPENIQSQEVSFFLINSFKVSFNTSNNIDFLKIFIRLYRVKWICIILKKLNENIEKNDFLFKKSKDYFITVGSLWQL